MEMVSVILAIYTVSLLALLVVVSSDARYYRRKFETERDLTQRLLAHVSRLQSQRSANVLPFPRKTNGQQRT
jgi:hypothetical protein